MCKDHVSYLYTYHINNSIVICRKYDISILLKEYASIIDFYDLYIRNYKILNGEDFDISRLEGFRFIEKE